MILLILTRAFPVAAFLLFASQTAMWTWCGPAAGQSPVGRGNVPCPGGSNARSRHCAFADVQNEMVELYRRVHCREADEIEEELQDISIAYRAHVVEEDRVPEYADLPAIRHDGKTITGRGDLQDYVQQLRRLMREWESNFGDYCIMRDDGTIR